MTTQITVKAHWHNSRPEIVARFAFERDARQWACDAASNGWGSGACAYLSVHSGSAYMNRFDVREVEPK